jgi:hypothetical protein
MVNATIRGDDCSAPNQETKFMTHDPNSLSADDIEFLRSLDLSEVDVRDLLGAKEINSCGRWT